MYPTQMCAQFLYKNRWIETQLLTVVCKHVFSGEKDSIFIAIGVNGD